MRGLAIDGPARPRKQPREILRRRARSSRSADPQAASRERAHHPLFASVEFSLRKAFAAAPCGSVDERKQALVVARRIVVVAILRANIDGRRGRQTAAHEDVVEFGAVIAREKHIVTKEREARRPSAHGERRRRERRLRAGPVARGALRLQAQQAGAQRSHIAVHYDGVRVDIFAIVERDARDAAGVDHQTLDVAPIDEPRAARLRQIGQRAGESVHAALDAPDAVHFDMRHEHQCRRRGEGRRSAIGGVAAEELAQARIAEIFSEFVPHRREGRDAQEVRQAAEARVTHEPQRTRALRKYE